VDSVACDGNIIAMAISEHVENAGTHSGDATMVLPAQDINDETKARIETIATSVAKALNVSGILLLCCGINFSVGGRRWGGGGGHCCSNISLVYFWYI
jgi:carbamoylphosphate synthase large subunit